MQRGQTPLCIHPPVLCQGFPGKTSAPAVPGSICSLSGKRTRLLAQRVLLTLCLQPANPGDSPGSSGDGVPATQPQQGAGPVFIQGIVLFSGWAGLGSLVVSQCSLVVSQCHGHINVPSPCSNMRLLRPSARMRTPQGPPARTGTS